MRISDWSSDVCSSDLLNTADVCVNPDEHNEMNDKSTMNKVMEYMALGKPIVQFDVFEGHFSAQDASAYARPKDPVRSEERRAGKGGVSTCRSRWAPYHKKKKHTPEHISETFKV